MAFNSTNKIRSVVVGEFEDKISQETAKAGASVNSTLKKMERQTKEATSGFESLEKTMKALGAAFVLQQGMQAATALVAYAREHNTQATSLVEKLDKTIDRTLAIVTNSEAFKSALSGTVTFLEKINELLGNVTDNVLKEAEFAVDINQASSVYVSNQLKSKDLTGEQRDILIEQEKLYSNNLKLATDNLETLKKQKQEQDAATTDKADTKPIELSLYDISKARMEMELETASKRVAYAKQLLDYAQRQKQIEASKPKPPSGGFPKFAPGEIPGGLPDTPVGPGPGFMAPVKELFGAGVIKDIVDVRENFQKLYSYDIPTFNQVATEMMNIISNGIGNAFENMGAAMARGQSAMGAFAKGMIAMAGQVASAFGDLFIKLGIGFIATGQIAMGIASIAAGAALKVLAGYMSAKASGGAPSSAGGFSGPAPARDYSTGNSQRKTGDTIVNVHINGDVMTLDKMDTDKRFNELAMKIGKSLDRQTNTLDRGFV